MGNLEEMDKFLETYTTKTETGRNRNFDQTHNLKEIELVIKICQRTRVQGQMAIQGILPNI